MLLERIDRQVEAERHVAAVFMAAGAKNVTLPTVEDARQHFLTALHAEPTVIDRDREELLRALGVRR